MLEMTDRKSQLPVMSLQPQKDQSRSSQETSPVRSTRTHFPAQHANALRVGNPESSPTRSATNPSSSGSTVPSAAAVQRALSAQRPVAGSLDGNFDGSRERWQRSGPNSPLWPTSPRLKSPPPSTIKNTATRKGDNEHPQTHTSKRLATVSAPEMAAAMLLPEIAKDPSSAIPISRASGRGVSAQSSGLETVAEGSAPNTPSIGPISNPADQYNPEMSALESTTESVSESASMKDVEAPTQENAAKSAAPKSEAGQRSRAASTSRPATQLARRSLTSLTNAKNKGVDVTRTMTVETEPVTSMPQLLGDRSRDGGSVRTKPSTETIRPKKDKKKASRKTAPLHAGTVTSKADIFEAKVASAVDEVDTSDSDETFVYESNPPEARSSRHHSRTPSAASMASQNDPYSRGKHGVRSGSSAITGKKSMKFSNSGYHDSDGADGSRNSTRTTSSTPRHHHIGRYGRNGHPSLFDNDSPFTQGNKPNSPRNPTGVVNKPTTSRPNSPRFASGRLPGSPRKQSGVGYDNYEDAADDERAPLMNSVRVNRNRHSRRPYNASFRAMESPEDADSNCCSRTGGCMTLGFLIALICVGIVTFVVALNRPLYDVEIKHIQNVLATEQELMLDLHVKAVNPNLFSIGVSNLDVYLFAISPYVGGTAEVQDRTGTRRSSWLARRHRMMPDRAENPYPWPPLHIDDGVDEGTDPVDDPDISPQKMLLGRVFEFDSPLMFDAAPIRRTPVSSVGEIRLAKPGNESEVGGSARWERVLQHPFDLIVRGVIKYQLPLSSKNRSAKIDSRVTVSPIGGGPGHGDDPKP